MAFLKSLVTSKTTAVAAATLAIPAAFAISSIPSSSQSSSYFKGFSKTPSFGSLCLSSAPTNRPEKSTLAKAFAKPASPSVEMDSKQSNQNGAVLPELLGKYISRL